MDYKIREIRKNEIGIEDLISDPDETQEVSSDFTLPDMISIDMAIARHHIRVKKYRKLYLRHTNSTAG